MWLGVLDGLGLGSGHIYIYFYILVVDVGLTPTPPTGDDTIEGDELRGVDSPVT